MASDPRNTPAAAPVRPTLREVDQGRYELGAEIARGGMGAIYEARDLRLDRAVAIKELLPSDVDIADRFRREALLTARLQHPSIVPIYEAGTWPTGEPFYAMKLVSGRSLADVIRDAHDLGARMALVPVVLAVTEAIAYAHSEGIIHRDLKPANVLVGRFGETVVIDWGLAKDLRAGEPDLPGDARRPSAGELTEAGEVLGTPVYMSPEQAAGEPVDQRADVFALGVMLYSVIAGRHPYDESKFNRSAAGSFELPLPIPLGRRQPQTPVELLALVDKAMARLPEERYPSAVELAADLRRFTGGQLVGAHRYTTRQLLARWARRHKAALAATGAALAAAATIGAVSVKRIVDARRVAETERARAVVQRATAIAQRSAADELIYFFLDHQRRELAQLGRLDLLQGVSERVEAYYATTGGDDPAALARRAKALEALGDIHLSAGRLDRALAAYQGCLGAASKLAALQPESGAAQLAVASAHGQIGDIHLARGDVDAALASYGTALAIMEKLAARPDAELMWRRGLGVAHNKVGTLRQRKGDLDGALASFAAARDIAEKLVVEQPKQLQLVADVADAYGYIGGAKAVKDDRDGALAAYEQAAQVWEKVHERAPKHLMVRFSVAAAAADLAEARARKGDAARALDGYRAVEAELRDLVAAEPDQADWRRELGILARRRGDALRERDPRAAAAAYREAVATADQLLAKQKDNHDWSEDREAALQKLGTLPGGN